jgi:putative protease
LQEIGLLCRTTSVELEIFVHGALCYSISGLCLASSFLGGSSGNRGRCTQVCRRKFKTGGATGYFFSPDDLCALDFLPQIKACDAVRSLKIEGRMKGPDYVYSVVKAFRMALDDPENLPAAKELAACDFGRRKTAFFLGGLRNPGIIDASEQSGMGELIGKIISCGQNIIVVASSAAIALNDRIRVQPETGFEGEAASVLHAEKCGDRISIVLKKPVACSPGDRVYLTGRKVNEFRFSASGDTDAIVPAVFKPACQFVGRVIASYRSDSRHETATQRETLWIKIDDASWLDHLHATPCQRLILASGQKEMDSLLADPVHFKSWRSRLVPSLPPFISENELQSWRELIGRFKTAGVTTWFCSNIGHRLLFDKGFTLIADAPIACLNRASQKAVLSQGFSFFTYSYEDDYLNIKSSGSEKGLACLYAAVQLFISRIHPAVRQGGLLSDPHDNRFFTASAHGLHYLLSQKPLCLTHRRKKLSELGIRNFIIDLCFSKVDPGLLQTIIDCYRNGTRLPDSSVFNFKAGLK